jgi:hypothetical protein
MLLLLVFPTGKVLLMLVLMLDIHIPTYLPDLCIPLNALPEEDLLI